MTTNQDPPKVRPGQRKGYVRGTRGQIDQRIGFVARMQEAGLTKTQIHRAVREKFNIEWRQCDRYIKWLMRGRVKYHQNAMAETCEKIQKLGFLDDSRPD